MRGWSIATEGHGGKQDQESWGKQSPIYSHSLSLHVANMSVVPQNGGQFPSTKARGQDQVEPLDPGI